MKSRQPLDLQQQGAVAREWMGGFPHHADLILSDVQLRGKGGIACLRERQTPVRRALGHLVGKGPRHLLVYLPSPDDREVFRQSNELLLPDSPPRKFPGSVGVLQLQPGKTIRIGYLQGSFRHIDVKGDKLIEPKTLRKYANWRRELLRRAFALAEEQGGNRVSLLLRSNTRYRGGAENEADFRTVAAEHGYEIIGKTRAQRWEDYPRPEATEFRQDIIAQRPATRIRARHPESRGAGF